MCREGEFTDLCVCVCVCADHVHVAYYLFQRSSQGGKG